jgi:hypothetical protein
MKFDQAVGPLRVSMFARTKELHTIEPINSEMPKTENMNRVYKLSKKKHRVTNSIQKLFRIFLRFSHISKFVTDFECGKGRPLFK